MVSFEAVVCVVLSYYTEMFVISFNWQAGNVKQNSYESTLQGPLCFTLLYKCYFLNILLTAVQHCCHSDEEEEKTDKKKEKIK